MGKAQYRARSLKVSRFSSRMRRIKARASLSSLRPLCTTRPLRTRPFFLLIPSRLMPLGYHPTPLVQSPRGIYLGISGNTENRGDGRFPGEMPRSASDPLSDWLSLDFTQPERSYNPEVKAFLAGLLGYPPDRVVTEVCQGGGYPDLVSFHGFLLKKAWRFPPALRFLTGKADGGPVPAPPPPPARGGAGPGRAFGREGGGRWFQYATLPRPGGSPRGGPSPRGGGG